MTTFSQLVDEMVFETRRPDLLSEISSYVNQTIREAHFTPDRGNAILFRDNLSESLLVASTADGYSWTIPNPQTFQAMQAVKYLGVWEDCKNPYAVERTPGRGMQKNPYHYYRASGYYVFNGYGGIDGEIALAYYSYLRSLKYYLPADRPATYDVEDGWEYAAGVVTDEQKLAAQEKVSNWMLLRWADVLREGIRAKIYKRTGDTERGRTSYSLYSQLRVGMFTGESAFLDGVS